MAHGVKVRKSDDAVVATRFSATIPVLPVESPFALFEVTSAEFLEIQDKGLSLGDQGGPRWQYTVAGGLVELTDDRLLLTLAFDSVGPIFQNGPTKEATLSFQNPDRTPATHVNGLRRVSLSDDGRSLLLTFTAGSAVVTVTTGSAYTVAIQSTRDYRVDGNVDVVVHATSFEP